MNEKVSVSELQKRWEQALAATGKAVADHPDLYADLKSLVEAIINHPLDIKSYFPTVKLLSDLLCALDPMETGSIFQLFRDRVAPKSIWQVSLLRVECKDLLSHLTAFEEWRKQCRHLRVMK